MPEPVIRKYVFQCRKRRCQVVGFWPTANDPGITRALARLGFQSEAVSGRRERGGEGVRNKSIWVMPQRRYDALPRVQAGIRLLLATYNPGPPGDRLNLRARAAAQAEVDALRGTQRTQR